MNAKRLAVALFVSLVVSAAFAFVLSRHLAKGSHGPASQIRYVVAAGKGLEAGEVLKAGNLRLIEWPVVLPGSFTKVDDLAGKVVLFPLTGNQPILAVDLASGGLNEGLAVKIPAGMRAISVRSDEVVGVAGFLLPGTHVDVLLTYRSDKSPEPRTTIVLQDVVVLAAGQQIRPDPEGKPASVTKVVTLLLKPDDSAKLVLATSLGAIHFVLRNGADQDKSISASVGIDELARINDPAAVGSGAAASSAAAASNAAARGEPPLKPKPYQAEAILGSKQMIKTLN
jgi:pilus assembly protein CpaB